MKKRFRESDVIDVAEGAIARQRRGLIVRLGLVALSALGAVLMTLTGHPLLIGLGVGFFAVMVLLTAGAQWLDRRVANQARAELEAWYAQWAQAGADAGGTLPIQALIDRIRSLAPEEPGLRVAMDLAEARLLELLEAPPAPDSREAALIESVRDLHEVLTVRAAGLEHDLEVGDALRRVRQLTAKYGGLFDV